MKIINHYIDSLFIVITYDLPSSVLTFTKIVGLDPSEAIYSLECLLAEYFSSVYYTKILIELLLPYIILNIICFV